MATIALVTLQKASAAIVDDGLWTGNDWYDEQTKIGVRNGIPYSNNWYGDRRIKAPLTIDGEVENHLERENVMRVKSLFSAQQFEEGFPHRDPLYTYDNFLKAISKFPNFCNESNFDNWTVE